MFVSQHSTLLSRWLPFEAGTLRGPGGTWKYVGCIVPRLRVLDASVCLLCPNNQKERNNFWHFIPIVISFLQWVDEIWFFSIIKSTNLDSLVLCPHIIVHGNGLGRFMPASAMLCLPVDNCRIILLGCRRDYLFSKAWYRWCKATKSSVRSKNIESNTRALMVSRETCLYPVFGHWNESVDPAVSF